MHFKEVCEDHGTVYRQCRCPGDKSSRTVPHGDWCKAEDVEDRSVPDLKLEDWCNDVLLMQATSDYSDELYGSSYPDFKTCARAYIDDEYVDLSLGHLLRLRTWIDLRIEEVSREGIVEGT